jgi:hypothetical protein
MIHIRSIEVDGLFDKPKPKRADVEIDVALGIARESRDVMNSQK